MGILISGTTEYKRNLAPAELRSLLGQAEPLQLVDVREHAEFASGRIAGARLLPLGEVQRRAAELDRSRPVICVCRSGKRSAQAMEKLAVLGFKGVHQLDGGLVAWEQAGFPLERDKRAPWALERQVRFAAGLLVLAGLGSSRFWPAAIALSWIVPTGLVFSALTDWCGMGLLLARMPWNRPTREGNTSCRV
jgi:rhodanese-related sulfurtransferase